MGSCTIKPCNFAQRSQRLLVSDLAWQLQPGEELPNFAAGNGRVISMDFSECFITVSLCLGFHNRPRRPLTFPPPATRRSTSSKRLLASPPMLPQRSRLLRAVLPPPWPQAPQWAQLPQRQELPRPRPELLPQRLELLPAPARPRQEPLQLASLPALPRPRCAALQVSRSRALQWQALKALARELLLEQVLLELPFPKLKDHRAWELLWAPPQRTPLVSPHSPRLRPSLPLPQRGLCPLPLSPCPLPLAVLLSTPLLCFQERVCLHPGSEENDFRQVRWSQLQILVRLLVAFTNQSVLRRL